jgi:hypothetical protein
MKAQWPASESLSAIYRGGNVNLLPRIAKAIRPSARNGVMASSIVITEEIMA